TCALPIYQHVDAAEMIVDRIDHPLAVVPASDMKAEGKGADAELLDLARDGLAGLQLAADDSHVRPRLGEALHQPPAQAARASGDDHDLALHVEYVVHRISPTTAGDALQACRPGS